MLKPLRERERETGRVGEREREIRSFLCNKTATRFSLGKGQAPWRNTIKSCASFKKVHNVENFKRIQARLPGTYGCFGV